MYRDFNDADIFPDTISDEELCRKAAEGSRRAEEILVTRYHRLVFRVAEHIQDLARSRLRITAYCF